jgi:hypothetical protein
VLSKCANPACLARFHYLHEGRIFKIETGAVSSDSKTSPTRRIEHFWLCERCVQTLTVVVENGVVIARPLHLELSEGAPEEKPEARRNVA